MSAPDLDNLDFGAFMEVTYFCQTKEDSHEGSL